MLYAILDPEAIKKKREEAAASAEELSYSSDDEEILGEKDTPKPPPTMKQVNDGHGTLTILLCRSTLLPLYK